MHGILSLVLLLPFSAKGAELRPIPAPKGGSKNAVKPQWARDMPPYSSAGYVQELRRRMAEGQSVRVRAAVQGFLPVALSSINMDFSPGVHVSGTRVKLVAPVKYKGLELLIHHQTPPNAESCWRAPGCKIKFDFPGRQLEAEQLKFAGMRFIYDSDLKDVVLGSPVAEKTATPSVDKDAGR